MKRTIDMKRGLLAVFALLAFVGTVTSPAEAAKPEIQRYDADDPAAEAGWSQFATTVCGFPVVADREGHFSYRFTDRGSHIEIDNYSVRTTFSSGNRSVKLVEGGPDTFWIGDDGHLYVAVHGRQETFWALAGRYVIDLTAHEAVSFSGVDLGLFTNLVCEKLA